MKVGTDSTRVFDNRPPAGQRVKDTAATPPATPTDSVQISALAGELSARGDDGMSQKVAELKRAFDRGENIVDTARIADGIIADARGDL